MAAVADVTVSRWIFICKRREQLQRYAVIQMDVRDRDVDGFVQDANSAIAASKSSCRQATGSNGAEHSKINNEHWLDRLSIIVPLTIFFHLRAACTLPSIR